VVTRGGTKEVEHERWNTRGGTQEVEHKRWNTRGGTREVEHKRWKRQLLKFTVQLLCFTIRAHNDNVYGAERELVSFRNKQWDPYLLGSAIPAARLYDSTSLV